MPSFEERQALAAKRSAQLQAQQAHERAERVRQESERKQKAEVEARERAKRERDLLVAREQRKKDDVAAKQRDEERRREQAEHVARRKREDAAAAAAAAAAGSSSSARIVTDAERKFKKTREKALESAGASSSLATPTEKGSSPGKRGGRVVDVDGFLSSSGPHGSTLTREERRARQRMAIFDGDGRRKKSTKRKQNTLTTGGELRALGTVKRDQRSIDEIEQDLLRAKRQKSSGVGASSASTSSSSGPLHVTAQRASVANAKHSAAKQTNGATTSSVHRRSGFNPADFLPGAPVRTTTTSVAVPSRKEAKKERVRQKEPETAVSATAKRKETARDRFIREEEERKRQRLKQQAGSQRFSEEYSDEEYSDDQDEEEEEEEEEEMEDEEETGGNADIRDEIWKLFGRKRSDYVGRHDDSDDDDMEADLESVRREEAQSARIARAEDEREEREEAARRARKAAKRVPR